MNYPLIMSSICQLRDDVITNQYFEGFLKTGRGNTKAIGLISSCVVPSLNFRVSNLSVGGKNIIENIQNAQIDFYSKILNPNRFLDYISLTSYKEGENVSVNMLVQDQPNSGPVPIAPTVLTAIAFYEGFNFFNPTKVYNSYKSVTFSKLFSGDEYFIPEKLVSISEYLPKNRGKIIGFSINYQQGEAGQNAATTGDFRPVNFSINGVTIIENIPAYYFDTANLTHKDFYFEVPIEGGQIFSFEIDTNNSSNPGQAGITFYFE